MAALEGSGGCPCTNDKEHFKSRLFYRGDVDVLHGDDARPGEFELPTAGDVE